MRPNILWIVFDTARADAFEPYGAPAGSTPVAGDLARRGEAVPGMHATACWTLPSHVSMFAGGMPRALGLADQAGLSGNDARRIVESLEDRLLATILTRAGYRTGAVSANAWVSRSCGFATGFERFEEVHTARHNAMGDAGRRARAAWLLQAARARVDDGAADAERVLGEWMTEADERPFFYFVNLVECHSPYLPPKPYAELGARQRMKAAAEAREYLTMEAFWRTCATGDIPAEDALERMRAGYRGAIRYMDDWLGRVLERLERAGRLDDTLVILSSDHGENFGEGNLVGHGFSLDERLINVPFVASGPGAERLSDARSLVQVPGRLAELAGAREHPYDPEAFPPLPVAQFDSPAPPPEDPRTAGAIRDWKLDPAGVDRLVSPLLAAVDGSVKLLVRNGAEAFYDLAADPLEERPLAPEAVEPAVAARLRAALEHASVQASVSLLHASGPEIAADELADLEDRMRLLGYL